MVIVKILSRFDYRAFTFALAETSPIDSKNFEIVVSKLGATPTVKMDTGTITVHEENDGFTFVGVARGPTKGFQLDRLPKLLNSQFHRIPLTHDLFGFCLRNRHVKSGLALQTSR